MLTEVTRVNEIEIHGNVQVYLTSGTTDQVKVYNNYYAENAMVQDQNGVLRITSYNTEKLVVWVTVNDLSKISAYDNAEVKSFGQFSAINLDMQLFDKASAKLNMDVYAANITLNDLSKAELAGNVTEATIQNDPSADLNIKGFTATHLVQAVKFPSMHHGRGPVELASL
jgi:hypothetical protein